jgi:hypothetical protein
VIIFKLFNFGLLLEVTVTKTRPAWAGFKTAEEGRTKIMLIYT